MVPKNEKTMCVNKSDVSEIINSELKAFSAEAKGRFDVVNLKLDNIQIQTEKINGRVSDLETDNAKKKIDQASRQLTCPHGETIHALAVDVVRSSELKKLFYRGIILMGFFFTVLFSILAILIRSDVFGFGI